MQIQYWCSLLSLVVAASGTESKYSTDLDAVEKRTYQKYCGKQINEILQMVCNSVYNPLFTAKKRNNEAQDGIDFDVFARKSEKNPGFVVMKTEDFDMFVAAVQNIRYPFASRSSSLSLLSANKNHGRMKRGIYDECCKSTCSISELTTYCAAK